VGGGNVAAGSDIGGIGSGTRAGGVVGTGCEDGGCGWRTIVVGILFQTVADGADGFAGGTSDGKTGG